MAFFVTCAFDLRSATRQDYEHAYSDLASIGLRKVIVGGKGEEVVAPTTMTAGTFTGDSASAVRDWVREKVKSAFAARRLDSEIFVVVGGNWAWGAATT
jgi:hypothetical protein